MLPIFLTVKNRLCVVVGGGPVGRRKAAALLTAGASVRLVCLEARPADETAAELEWLCEPYRPAHLDGSCLVFAAGGPEVNRAVQADAQQRGLWCNVADDPQGSDFFMPATVRRGTFTLAIGTGGASPALARQVRLRLETEFDDTFAAWTALLAEMRPLVRATIADPMRRRRVFRSLCHWRWLRRLRQHGPETVRDDMLAHLRTLAQSSENPL